MSKHHKKRFTRRLHGHHVEGITIETPEEVMGYDPAIRQPDSVAMLTCPVCLAKRYVNQAWFDFGKEAKHVAVEGVPDDFKEAATQLEMLPRHKPCNAIMQVVMLSKEEKKQPTTERLAQALREAGAPPEMIEQALAGVYDDWKSELALPLIQLAIDAKNAGLGPAFHQRIINGDFDGTKEESDAWASSEEGQATFRQFSQQVEQRPNRVQRRQK